MALRYNGEFPSKEQFASSGKSLPSGDKLREILHGYPVVRYALLAPSAEKFAYDAGMSAQDVPTLSNRAGEVGIAGLYRATTGLPVIAHSGHVIDLGGTGDKAAFEPAEDPIDAIRATDTETQQAVAKNLAANHTSQQLLGLAQALIAQAMKQE